jgi:hypothetical protein
MTWTIYSNDKAWGFLSADERRAFSDHEGDIEAFDFAAQSWADNYQGGISGGSVLRAAPEPTPAVDADKTAQLDIANARIAELEAAIVTARADALHEAANIANGYGSCACDPDMHAAILRLIEHPAQQDTFFGLGNRKFTEAEMQQIATGVADAISKKYTRTDIANARIAELEAEIVTARADALRDVQRIKADRDQGMLDYCALMERYDAAIQNPTKGDTPCSPL